MSPSCLDLFIPHHASRARLHVLHYAELVAALSRLTGTLMQCSPWISRKSLFARYNPAQYILQVQEDDREAQHYSPETLQVSDPCEQLLLLAKLQLPPLCVHASQRQRYAPLSRALVHFSSNKVKRYVWPATLPAPQAELLDRS